MFNDIFLFFVNAFTFVSSWFSKIFTASGVAGFYLVCIFLCLLVRFIFQPVIGSSTFTAASDRVRQHKKEGI